MFHRLSISCLNLRIPFLNLLVLFLAFLILFLNLLRPLLKIFSGDSITQTRPGIVLVGCSFIFNTKIQDHRHIIQIWHDG